jgi:hypothetical protein
MPENTWIRKKRLRTLEGVEIGAANAHRQDAYQHFARAGRPRWCGVGKREPSRLFQDDCLHGFQA